MSLNKYNKSIEENTPSPVPDLVTQNIQQNPNVQVDTGVSNDTPQRRNSPSIPNELPVEDVRAYYAEKREDAEKLFTKIFNAGRKKKSELEEMTLLLSRVFRVNPNLPEAGDSFDKLYKGLFRIGAPEIAEALRECIRAAEVDRKGVVNEEYCRNLKMDRVKQAVERINQEINQLYAKSGINDIMLLGLNGVAEAIGIVSKEVKKAGKLLLSIYPELRSNEKVTKLSEWEGAGLLKLTTNKMFDGLRDLIEYAEEIKGENKDLYYRLKFYAEMGVRGATKLSNDLMAALSCSAVAKTAKVVREGDTTYISADFKALPLWMRKKIEREPLAFAGLIARERGIEIKEVVDEIIEAEKEGTLKQWLEENFRVSFTITPDVLLGKKEELNPEDAFDLSILNGEHRRADLFYGRMALKGGEKEIEKDPSLKDPFVFYGVPLLKNSLEVEEVEGENGPARKLSIDQERFNAVHNVLKGRFGEDSKLELVAKTLKNYFKDGVTISWDEMTDASDDVEEVLKRIKDSLVVSEKKDVERALRQTENLDVLERRVREIAKQIEEEVKTEKEAVEAVMDMVESSPSVKAEVKQESRTDVKPEAPFIVPKAELKDVEFASGSTVREKEGAEEGSLLDYFKNLVNDKESRRRTNRKNRRLKP